MRFLFNPLSHRFEIKQTASASAPAWIDVLRDCDAAVAIGDFVYVDPVVVNKVVKNTDNAPDYPTIGAVTLKPTATTCRVRLYGEVTGMSGLTQADYVFLSITGTATSVPPTTDYVQILGYALSSTTMIVNPQILRTRRAV